MTAQDMITMAVNSAQNRLDETRWISEDSPFGARRFAHNEAERAMLREVYAQLLDTNLAAMARRGFSAAGLDEAHHKSRQHVECHDFTDDDTNLREIEGSGVYW